MGRWTCDIGRHFSYVLFLFMTSLLLVFRLFAFSLKMGDTKRKSFCRCGGVIEFVVSEERAVTRYTLTGSVFLMMDKTINLENWTLQFVLISPSPPTPRLAKSSALALLPSPHVLFRSFPSPNPLFFFSIVNNLEWIVR